ncbi:MAG: Gfo/Idh/MocA family oxidoreductase [Alphaproteobacteria bacterium]|nr:Gfo/Idh/MocA family oxidoreductase [Alphaproteobacteria bacterium]
MVEIKRLGFLGAGPMARAHGAAAVALGAEIAAVCTAREDSPNWDEFKKITPHARHMTDGEALFADDAVDAVVACLPWDVMPQWAVRLMETPKPVLMEKPIGFDADEARVQAEAVTATLGNKLVGYNRRFYETVIRLRERVEQGGLKAVRVVISESVESQIERHGRDIVAHLVPSCSAHTLDLMVHIFGPLHPVALAPFPEKGKAAPFVSFNGVLATAENVPVTFSLNADDPANTGMRCLFDDDTAWELSPLETLTVYKGLDIEPPTSQENIRRYSPQVEARHGVDASIKPGCRDQMAAFLSGKYGPGATVDDAVAVLDLMASLDATAKSWPRDGDDNNNTMLGR